jgi:serine protease Do
MATEKQTIETVVPPSQPKKTHAGWGIFLLVVLLGAVAAGAYADRVGYVNKLNRYLPKQFQLPETQTPTQVDLKQTVLTEESVVTAVAEQASPSVVTVSVTTSRQALQPFFMDPFGMFGGQQFNQPNQQPDTNKQNIGSGFVVDGQQGLIVTNKHVVSDTNASFTIITKDDKEFTVKKIYRDPTNDLAILKIDGQLPAVQLGDSDKLKVGQFVIAMGTALGEFRNTVTTGVVSGLGRGINAGDAFGGVAERLDNVIQTDAAINPGNSGGPILNSAGQVIGVNVAVAQQGQNIGFALPINVVKKSLENFNTTGQFDRPFLGVQYRIIPKDTALMNDVPEGAYVVNVVTDSPAEKAGIKQGDIIVKLGDQNVKDASGGLATLINNLKVGQTVTVQVYRDGKTIDIPVTLQIQDQSKNTSG